VLRMRLSEALELPEFKTRDIVVIGFYKSQDSTEFAVLARRGEKVFPITKMRHLVEVTPEDRDPVLDPSEMRSILSRFQYFESISRLP
jgi:hypothetical protein